MATPPFSSANDSHRPTPATAETQSAIAGAWADLLGCLRLTGAVFLDARFTAPWSVVTNVQPEKLQLYLAPARRVIGFHYVTSGHLVGHLVNGTPVDLKAGDLILLPHNDLHVWASTAGLAPVAVGDLVYTEAGSGLFRLDHGGGGDETRLICGYLGSDVAFDALISALPPMLTLNLSEMTGGAWIAESMGFAAQHLASGAAGAPAIVGKLSELMFSEAVRRHVESMPVAETGWFAGLRDPAVSKALAMIHAEPERGWSSDELARAVNMSRSAFADRFSRLTGQPPIRYLTARRMQLAAHELRATRKTVAQIAFDVGYESEAAFTRAFRRELGQPPATWRRLQADRPRGSRRSNEDGRLSAHSPGKAA
jgi:AraC-like DNA-binding protein